MIRTRRWCLALAGSVVACALTTAAPAYALDPTRPIAHYVRDAWTMADGLPQDSITAILQTRDGFIWLGTLDGLVRFDGVRFDTTNLIRAAGIQSNVVTALAEAPDGALWVGTGAGLLRLTKGTLTVFGTAQGLADNSVRCLRVAHDGSLWIGLRWGGISHYADARLTTVIAPRSTDRSDVFGLAEGPDGTMWAATASGLLRVADGQATPVLFPGLDRSPLVSAVHVDTSARLWVGTTDGLWTMPTGADAVSPALVRHALEREAVRTIFEDQQGSLWLGLRSGLGRVRGATVETGSAATLSYPNIRSLAADREGNLWVGTDGGGLNRLRDSSLTTVELPAGTPQDSVMTIHRDRSGRMWTGSSCAGLSRWDDTGVVTFTRAEGLPNSCVRSLASAPDGDIWAGTLWGVGVLRNDRVVRVISAEEGLSGNRVMAIAFDREGTAWIGTSDGGLNRVTADGITHIDTGNGLVHNDVRAILEARDGAIWIGTMGGGISIWKNGAFSRLTQKEGLSNNNVLALHEDADGTMWVGTNGAGVNRVRGGRVTTYSTTNGLFSDGVFRILDDGHGYLWMSCNRGVFRVSRQQLDEVAEGRLAALHPESFGRDEGLTGGGVMGGTQPAGDVDTNGRLWFPTIRGVAIFDPARLVRNTVPPRIEILGVRIDGVDASDDRLLTIPPGDPTIEIDYTALTYVAPRKARFRLRLLGFSDRWEEAGARRTAYFRGLRPGHYRFEVQGANNDGVWSTTVASTEFELRPYFFQTAWFIAGCSVVLVGLVAGALYRRDRRNRAREAELQQQVAENLAQIKVLSGLLPICAWCKRIRDDDGGWRPVESYIQDHSQAAFSHSICPECTTKVERGE